MKRIATAIAATTLALLGACGPQPQSGSSGGTVGGVPLGPYFLVGIGADAVPERNATLILSNGTISGQGPCNGFSATNSATLPAMAVTNLTSTLAACKELRFEQRYFTALQQVTEAEYDGGLLILKGPTWLQFEAGYPVQK